MTATIYLEAEDEITAAVARIRAVGEGEAIVVISRASRIGTSRINFKLLAREAHTHGVDLVAVSDEPTVRALAVSAGVPAYDSVPAAQAALEQFRRQDEQLARRTGRLPAEPVARPPAEDGAVARSTHTSRSEHTAPDRTEVLSSALMAAAGATTHDEPRVTAASTEANPPPAGTRSRRARRLPIVPLVLLALLAVVAAGGTYAAYLYLPTATVTLRPHAQPVGPLEVRVTAQPSVAVPDAAAGVIPAETIRLELSVGGDFTASGAQVVRTPATGTVEFTSENTVSDVPIPAATVVSTEDGIEFETLAAVIAPRASFQTGPTQVTVDVRARNPGVRGNVAADTITQLPPELVALVISVTNPQPTRGGTREELAVVTQEDYDAAVEQLTIDLAAELDARLADPATTPRGLTLYPATVRRDEPRVAPVAEEIVDSATDMFTVALETTATVLAVNEALVEQVAAERLRATLEPGATLVGDRIEIERDSSVGVGASVVYRVTASARAYREPDRQALVDAVRGKTLSEARAILEQHGTVEISVWPEVVDRVPEQAARISLTILPPQESP